MSGPSVRRERIVDFERYFVALRAALAAPAFGRLEDPHVRDTLHYVDQILEVFGREAAASGVHAAWLGALGPLVDGTGDDRAIGEAEALIENYAATGNADLAGPVGAIAAAEQRRLAQWRAMADAAAPAPVAPIDERAALQAWIDGRPDAPRTRIDSVRTLAGGRSKITRLIEVEQDDGRPASWVMRQDTRLQLGLDAGREFALLDSLNRAGIPVAMPILVEPSPSALGAPFMLTSRIEGRHVGQFWGLDEQSPHLLVALARLLGAIHSLPVDRVDIAGARDRLSPHAAVTAMLDDFEGRYRRQHFGRSIALALGFAWLRRNIDVGAQRTGLVHGDVGFHNILFDGDRLAALLDWELAHVGDPAEDIGYVHDAVVATMPWDDFLGHYHAAGGPPVDAAQLRYFSVWRAVRNSVMALGASALFLDGGSSDLGVGAAALWTMPIFEASIMDLIGEDFVAGQDDRVAAVA